MTMGEIGQTARTAIDAFKSNPACLAVICLAALVFVLTYFALQEQADRRHEEFAAVLERCIPSVIPGAGLRQ